jgi:Tol biopolymer transport system component
VRAAAQLARAALALAALALAPPLAAERRPVYAQIDLPHPYYYHEMYLPQLTAGPSGLAFSPDSKELVYSMAGSLWRQRLDSTVALQLTDGPGYDYQPDWSPDGRSVVYSTYAQGALELRLLDLTSGTSRALTSGGAVNVEPRFSPDGKQIAFVSTSYHGRFHVFAAPLVDGAFGPAVRLTGETRSELRRYYYSPFEHELSPTWTRDGRSLIFVSNRGHVHGTGGFWAMEAKAGAEPRELHYEETNWRARPEVSPDGVRLLYSSYLGRNWHQLWLMPATGGDALPISYGDFDATSARWSPDGKQIAYISNAAGGTELRLHEVAGGAERTLEVLERRTLAPTGHVHIKLTDAHGQPAAARVSVTDARGRFHAPAGAWIHADDGYDPAEQPFEAHYFHARGVVDVEVPAGAVTVELLRGFSQPLESHALTVTASATVELASSAAPAPDAAWGGGHWVSGDVHVHMNYGGTYRNTPAHLIEQAEAENLAIVESLIVNKEQRVPDIAYSGRGQDPASTASTLVIHGQEFHTSYWGHLGILGPSGATLIPGYAGYANTAVASLVPMNADVADLAHARGALVGYVHPFDEEVHPFKADEPLTHELPVDLALGKVDYIEITGFADHKITAGVWYRLLNLGFRLPAAGGTDAMANYASLRGPVGMNRVFVRVPDAPLEHRAWLEGLKAGRSVASNGPMLDFTLGYQAIGGELTYPGPQHSVPFRARLRSIVPVDHFELVCNGVVVRNLKLPGTRTNAEVEGAVALDRSGWCLVRASSEHAEYPVLDNYVYATTSPVYVTIKGARPHSAADADYFVAWVDRVRESTESYPDWNTAAERARVLATLESARAAYAALR